MIKKLGSLFTRRDKQVLLGLFFFSIFISLLEMIGVSIIMPFISVASDFSLIDNNEYFRSLYQYFSFASPIDFVVAFGFFLIFFYLFRSGVNLFYFYLLSRFSRGRYHLLAYRLFENYLGMSYRNFIEKNSSELNKTIVQEAHNLTLLLSSFLFMISEVFVVILIYSMMLYINWKITILLSLILGVNAVFIVKFITPKIKRAGDKRERFQKDFFEIINSTLGNFKLIKLKSDQQEIMDRFSNASYGYAKSNIANETFGQFPRLFLEAIGFSIISFIVIYLVLKYQSDISGALALISMFVVGLYRLMPSVNRILTSYNQIMFYSGALDIVHNDLMYDSEILSQETIEFNRSIELHDVYFGYNEEKLLFSGLELKIEKGQSIAFVGESGGGKSTLVDLIMGLYRPVEGGIMIDGVRLTDHNIRAWRQKIGYIPQSIYLFDGTVAQNVAFGSDIDAARVKEVLRQANILEFLERHQEGIETVVGEGGIKLSGGQKQRIAIARALYNDPEVLVLDEATSALDTETEAKIMDEIYEIAREKTLIIIAHRLSTIERCDRKYKLENGRIDVL